MDCRFNKLEKTVGQIHNEFKMKMFEGIVNNQEAENPMNMNRLNSLTLDFGKENQRHVVPEKVNREGNVQWNDVEKLYFATLIKHIASA